MSEKKIYEFCVTLEAVPPGSIDLSVYEKLSLE